MASEVTDLMPCYGRSEVRDLITFFITLTDLSAYLITAYEVKNSNLK